MNAYEVKAGMVFFAGKKLCDPCLITLRWFVYHARRYTSALLFLHCNKFLKIFLGKLLNLQP